MNEERRKETASEGFGRIERMVLSDNDAESILANFEIEGEL